MDKLSKVYKKRCTSTTRQAKSKKKPIKLVYISNPMKVETSASKFMALVQQLTGQDSDVADMAKFSEIVGVASLSTVDEENTRVTHAPDSLQRVLETNVNRNSPMGVTSPFELFDDFFTPHMVENYKGFLPSNLFHDPQLDLSQSLGAV